MRRCAGHAGSAGHDNAGPAGEVAADGRLPIWRETRLPEDRGYRLGLIVANLHEDFAAWMVAYTT